MKNKRRNHIKGILLFGAAAALLLLTGCSKNEVESVSFEQLESFQVEQEFSQEESESMIDETISPSEEIDLDNEENIENTTDIDTETKPEETEQKIGGFILVRKAHSQLEMLRQQISKHISHIM